VTLRRATKTKKTTISATARQPFSATSRGVIYESVNKKKKETDNNNRNATND
jgi:hypothetical protein